MEKKEKWIIIIILALVGIIITGCIYSNNGDINVFADNFKNADEVALIMDIRGSNSLDVNHKIMTCGIGLSSGNAFVGKDLYIYGIEQERCFISYPNDTHDADATIQKCETEIRDKLQIHIKPGNEDKTIFEANKMILYITEDYTGECALYFE